MKKLFVVGRGVHYADWVKNVELTNNITEADLVMFTGGEDVNPALYGATKHPSTYYTERRDQEEVSAFKAMRPDQCAIGICRGLN